MGLSQLPSYALVLQGVLTPLPLLICGQLSSRDLQKAQKGHSNERASGGVSGGALNGSAGLWEPSCLSSGPLPTRLSPGGGDRSPFPCKKPSPQACGSIQDVVIHHGANSHSGCAAHRNPGALGISLSSQLCCVSPVLTGDRCHSST